MRKETILNFEQTKELSYLNTLFDMIDKGKKRIESLENAKSEVKKNEVILLEEIKRAYEKLRATELTDYMIQKHIDQDHRYRFIYFLRKINGSKPEHN